MAIRNKILLSFLVFLIIMMTGVVLAIQLELKPAQYQQAEQNTLQMLTTKGNETGAWLGQRISEIRMLHEHPACRSLDLSQLREYVSALNEMMQVQYGNPRETIAIGGLDGQGWVNDEITIDISNRNYFKKAMTGEEEYVFSQPVVSKSDNNRIFLICYPVLNEQKEIIGFINTSVNLDFFSQLVKDMDIYGGYAWIMDKEGTPYTGTQEELEQYHLTNQVLKETIAQSKTQTKGVLPLYPLTQEKRSLFYTEVPFATDWVLCVVVENQAIYAQSNHMIRLLFVMFSIAILVAIGLAIIISGSIARPIQQLTEHMLNVSENPNMKPLVVHGTDEVSVLEKTYNAMMEEMRTLSQAQLEAEQQKRKAELRSLQSQIQPHFLYNTLDTIQWQALEHGAYSVADMVQLLSRFFRISLSDGKEMITVKEELSQVEAYLQIQKVRYREKISYTIHIIGEVESTLIPKLILQPLVENSIYHGIKPKKGNGNVCITVKMQEKALLLQVEDDGVGMSQEQLQELRDSLSYGIESDHYGLYNVNERLILAYGERYTLHVESVAEKGTKVQIFLVQ